MEKMNGKLVTFTGIIVLVLLVAIFGFLFWEPKPEYIQGEAEATETLRRFKSAEGVCVLQGAVFDIDESTGKCRSVQRIEEDYVPGK